MNRFERMTIVLAIGIAAACAKTEPAATAPPPTTATAASSTTTTAATATAATATTTPPAPAAAPAAAPVAGAIANTDGERSGAHIDVTELKRGSGETVTLKFVLTNNSNNAFAVSDDYLGDSQVSKDHWRDLSGIHLIDPINKKKYFVVTDSDKSCFCSKNIDNIAAGGKVSLWAKFPAPPPEVTKVGIEIPHFQPMDDVLISQ